MSVYIGYKYVYTEYDVYKLCTGQYIAKVYICTFDMHLVSTARCEFLRFTTTFLVGLPPHAYVYTYMYMYV